MRKGKRSSKKNSKRKIWRGGEGEGGLSNNTSSTALSSIGDTLSSTLSSVSDTAATATQNVTGAVSGAANSVTSVASNAAQNVTGAVSGAFNSVTSAASNAAQNVSGVVSKPWWRWNPWASDSNTTTASCDPDPSWYNLLAKKCPEQSVPVLAVAAAGGGKRIHRTRRKYHNKNPNININGLFKVYKTKNITRRRFKNKNKNK
jgi:hypothetical protein